MKILLKDSYKSLPKNLEINDLPGFIVITGENGSGKSQLLDCIRSNGTDNISTNFINWVSSDCKAASSRQSRQQHEAQISTINQGVISLFR